MQRKLISCFICTVFLFCCVGCGKDSSVPQYEGETVPSVTLFVPSDSPFTQETLKQDLDSICTGESGTNQEVVDAVNLQLLQLPRWIRQAFIQSGWSMSVVSYDIATEDYAGVFDPGTVFGSTSYKNRSIKILNTMRAAANSPIHELGHWMDSYMQYPTLNDEVFSSIFEAEGESYRSTFGPVCSWNVQEFFAEGFWCYWRSPNLLRKSCPQFCDYLENKLVVAQSLGEKVRLDG